LGARGEGRKKLRKGGTKGRQEFSSKERKPHTAKKSRKGESPPERDRNRFSRDGSHPKVLKKV